MSLFQFLDEKKSDQKVKESKKIRRGNKDGMIGMKIGRRKIGNKTMRIGMKKRHYFFFITTNRSSSWA